MKKVVFAIVKAVKGKPGDKLGEITRNVPEDEPLFVSTANLRKEMKEEAEGVIFIENHSYLDSVHEYMRKQEAKEVKAEKLTSTSTSVPAEEHEPNPLWDILNEEAA